MTATALKGLRVLDLSQGYSGPYCTKFLASLGAEVIKIEDPSQGDCSRTTGPFLNNAPNPEASAPYLYLNTGKKSVALDLETGAGREALAGLIPSADVLVENFRPGHMASLGLDYPSLETMSPRLVMASITYFGQTGPYRDYKGNSMIGYAMTGQMYMTGDADGQPLMGAGHQPEYQAGLHAFDAIMAALYWRGGSGRGQHIDVSVMEAMAYYHEFAITTWTHTKQLNTRSGNRLSLAAHPVAIYPCKDGYVSFTPAMPHQIDNLFILVERVDMLDDPRFGSNYQRWLHADEMDEVIVPWLMAHTMDEVLAGAQELRIPSAKVNNCGRLFKDPQVNARDYWVSVDHPAVGPQVHAGAPFKMSETPWQVGTAPLLGQHTKEILGGAQAPAMTQAPGPRIEEDGEQPPALDRVRVLDLTRGWSGPICARFLADLGAEVIKVETLTGRGMLHVEPPDPMTYETACAASYPNNDPGDEPYNRYGPFNDYHRNKLSLTLDLTREECKEAFRQLAMVTDVVVENYSPRVMKNFGLDYPVLKEINPSIVMISMPGFGMYGPHRNHVSYGTNINASCGIDNLTGYPGSGPYMSGEAVPDPNGGINAVAAILTALYYRETTGRGQFIDLSQNEASIGLIGEQLLAYSMNGVEPERTGNRHPYHAPHGCYRCRGVDRWVTIAVTSEAEWKAFCDVLGNPEWTGDKRFSSQPLRWENQEELDTHISRWTAERDYKEVMHTLQARGVPAGAVFTNQDVAEDPHLWKRGYIWEISHPRAGTLPFPGVPVRLSKTPGRLFRATPLLGEHNDYLLREVLGLDPELITRLEEEEAIGTHPPAAHVGPAYG